PGQGVQALGPPARALLHARGPVGRRRPAVIQSRSVAGAGWPAPSGATGCPQPVRPGPGRTARVEDNPWHPRRGAIAPDVRSRTGPQKPGIADDTGFLKPTMQEPPHAPTLRPGGEERSAPAPPRLVRGACARPRAGTVPRLSGVHPVLLRAKHPPR